MRVIAILCACMATTLSAQGVRSSEQPAPRQRPTVGGAIYYPVYGNQDVFSPDFARRMTQHPKAKNAEFIFRTSRDQRAQFAASMRTVPSEPESHERWDEVYLFHSGEGIIDLHGLWEDAGKVRDGELRGGHLQAPEVMRVSPGDIVRIPARVPHRLRPSGNAPLLYLVLRALVPAKPQF